MPKGTNKETGSQFDENRASCGFAADPANLILARNSSLASYRRTFTDTAPESARSLARAWSAGLRLPALALGSRGFGPAKGALI
jgi:hypothetical protein